MSDLSDYLEANDSRIHDELFELLRIPSVSPSSDHAADIARAADWIASSLEHAGMCAQIYKTSANPIVVGEWRQAPDAPTVLVYGHYDVQPPDPLDGWTSPPFEPAVREGKIYARGVVDDKAQIFLHIKVIEAHLAVRGRLPINVVMLIEGEEEIGSASLAPFLRDHLDLLRAEDVLIADTQMLAPDIPAIVSSMRGIVYFQIDVRGPSQDLHSGSYGGAVVNPASALARIIASLHDEEGRIAVQGFYDRVEPWNSEILPLDEDSFRREAGVTELGGDMRFSVRERLTTRPACDVHGLSSGYTGEGAKTVLPATASAKLSCRLVHDQSPDEIAEQFIKHIGGVTPRGVSAKVTVLGLSAPWRGEVSGPLFHAAQRALEATFGRKAVIIGEGATLPILNDFHDILGAPLLLLGFGLPGSNMHAPNEWMGQENFRKGMKTIAKLWDEYAAP